MPLNVELRRVKARDLKPQAVNARYMAKDQFDALVTNIREDGVLTSTPLLYQPGGVGDVEIVSGHHRTLAVLEALGEDAEYDAMVVLDAQSRDQIIARQLSHNSISGVDDPATLKRLWEEIEDVDWKKYAALDDRTLKLLAEVDLTGLSELNLDFTTITLVFLPHERDRAEQALAEAHRIAGAKGHWLAGREQYDPTLDALATVHQAWGVGNVATALQLVLDVFEANLEATQAAWLSEEWEPARKAAVPVESLLATRVVPAEAAAVVVRALQKVRVDAGDKDMPLARALELLAADYLGNA
jgi:hypothetical protein